MKETREHDNFKYKRHSEAIISLDYILETLRIGTENLVSGPVFIDCTKSTNRRDNHEGDSKYDTDLHVATSIITNQ